MKTITFKTKSFAAEFKISIECTKASFMGADYDTKLFNENSLVNDIIDKMREMKLGNGARAYEYWDMVIE